MTIAYAVTKQVPDTLPADTLIADCYAAIKRAKAPKTVAEVRTVVEAKRGPCAVRHTLKRLERAGYIVPV